MAKKIRTANALFKLVRTHRKEEPEGRLDVLFVSSWEKHSKRIMDQKVASGKEIVVIDTFDIPEASVSFKVTKLPCLMSIIPGPRGSVLVREDYLPKLYEFFNS